MQRLHIGSLHSALQRPIQRGGRVQRQYVPAINRQRSATGIHGCARGTVVMGEYPFHRRTQRIVGTLRDANRHRLRIVVCPRIHCDASGLSRALQILRNTHMQGEQRNGTTNGKSRSGKYGGDGDAHRPLALIMRRWSVRAALRRILRTYEPELA